MSEGNFWLLKDSIEAFEIIKQARKRGRQIIPLYGSGISIDSGFPVASHLSEYLVRFQWWLKLERKGSIVSYLRSHPWPSRHNLNSDLWSNPQIQEMRSHFEFKRQQEEANLNREALVDELRRAAPTAAFAMKGAFENLKRSRTSRAVMSPIVDASSKIHPYTGYRSLLNYLCDRDTNLIDGFFDHYARNRRPSTTHHFIAFAAQLLGSRLILTTNFDNFIETALKNEGLDPSVYEVTRDGGAPSAQLLRSQRLSVVKLHGGAYSLRTGFDLDDHLSPGDMAEYREYFRLDTVGHLPPLVLAIGYSGSDRRVMDMLSTHLTGWGASESRDHRNGSDRHGKKLDEVQILWISRGSTPPSHLVEIQRPYYRTGDPEYRSETSHRVRSPVAICEYRDARLFLDELHQRLTNQHPASRTHYASIISIPRTPGIMADKAFLWNESRSSRRTLTLESAVRNAGEFRRFIETERGIAFVANDEGGGSSSHLSKACRVMDSTHTILWIDASETRSRAAFFAMIADAFHKFDRNLTMITRPLICNDVDFVYREIENVVDRDPTPMRDMIDDFETVTALRWIRAALRRGRYILAIDSLGDFGVGHPATADATGFFTRDEDGNLVQLQKTLAFLKELISPTGGENPEIGESKIFMAITKNRLYKKDSPENERTAERMANDFFGSSIPIHVIKESADRGVSAVIEIERMMGVRIRGAGGSDYCGKSDAYSKVTVLPQDAVQTWKNCKKALVAAKRATSQAREEQEKEGGNGPAGVATATAVKVAINAEKELEAEAARKEKPVRDQALAWIVIVASFYRRQRSHAMLTTTLIRSLHLLESAGKDSLLAALLEAFKSTLEHEEDDEKRLNIIGDMVLETSREFPLINIPEGKYSKSRFLTSLEGGNYWMHRSVRDAVFKRMVSKSERGGPASGTLELDGNQPASIFSLLADFYHDDVYERSHDSSAFIEYMYHRTISISSLAPNVDPTERLRRANWLVAAVEIEKDKLLAHGRLPHLLNHLRRVLKVLLDPEYEEECQKLDLSFPTFGGRAGRGLCGQACLERFGAYIA